MIIFLFILRFHQVCFWQESASVMGNTSNTHALDATKRFQKTSLEANTHRPNLAADIPTSHPAITKVRPSMTTLPQGNTSQAHHFLSKSYHKQDWPRDEEWQTKRNDQFKEQDGWICTYSFILNFKHVHSPTAIYKQSFSNKIYKIKKLCCTPIPPKTQTNQTCNTICV